MEGSEAPLEVGGIVGSVAAADVEVVCWDVAGAVGGSPL